jgi:hypothetical protein
MRFLIGFYLLLGFVQVGMSCFLACFAIRLRLAAVARGTSRGDHLEETLFIAALELLLALLRFLAAYGLWKRWRMLRLVRIGLSCWALALCAYAAVVAVAKNAGLTDGRAFGVPESPSETLALAGTMSAFALLHLWLLVRRPVREAYRSLPEPAATRDRDDQ